MIDLLASRWFEAFKKGINVPDFYTGKRENGQCSVWADERRLDPKVSLQVRNHSPAGFEWGYHGSGPAQLALALLLDVGLPSEIAERLHQGFKRSVVSHWPQQAGWTMRGSLVIAWIEGALQELA